MPKLRIAAIKPSSEIVAVTLPATTTAFAQANIFARASGYIDKRNVDIGDQVKQGQLLAEITAPELDHQIAQAEATIAQSAAALRQAQANADLANVTWGRDKPLVDKGWLTQQQGTVDQQTVNAQAAAVSVAQSNVVAQQAQLNVLQQQKDYQSVVAPFDGVITQRNIDVGSLVQADATTGTFMFTIMQSSVIRTQVHVPQDAAFGVEPGIAAKMRVPEMPGARFPGKVTRIADALRAEHSYAARRDRRAQPRWRAHAGHLLRGGAAYSAQDPSFNVPADAIMFNADGLRVAVLEGGTAHIREVTVTRDLGTSVEVSEGVHAGDQVILNPPVDLAEGGKVETRPELTASSN